MGEKRSKLLMVSDLLACDVKVLDTLRKQKRGSLRMVSYFILGFLGFLAIFSSYEALINDDEYSREKRVSRGKSNTMVVSVMHVDYGILNVEPDFILLPVEADLSVAPFLKNCCGLVQDGGNSTGSAKDDALVAEVGSVLPACRPTAQIRLLLASPFWTIQTLDEYGKEKKVGGDELYVDFSSSNTEARRLVAKVSDLNDGKYQLDFLEPPLSHQLPDTTQKSAVTITLLYTCGMGRFGPPLKSTWESNGALLRVFGFEDSIDHNSRRKSIQLLPPSVVRRPWQDASVSNGGRNLKGITPNLSNNRKTRGDQNLLMLEEDEFVFFGDENMLAWGQAMAETFLNDKPFVHTGNHTVRVTVGSLSNQIHLLDEWHGFRLRFPDDKKVALILGTSFLDLSEQESETISDFNRTGGSWDMVDHLVACESLIRVVQDEFPDIALYWRLPIPIPFHRYPLRCHMSKEPRDAVCQDYLQYFSYYRMQEMYQAQKQLMEELKVPVFDVFDAYYVSADHYIVEDRVFSAELHKRVMLPFFQHHNRPSP
jgi:hypothetical protein